jgi:undecaprenyl-diphosphatase
VTPSAAAEFLATHALLMLAAALLLTALAVGAVMALARAAVGYKEMVWRAMDVVVPGHLWRPRTFLAVHLALGLVLAAAVVVFADIAEDALGGDELADFDVAFAAALHGSTSPVWHTFFWYLTWLGSAPAITAISTVVVVRLVQHGRRLLALMFGVSQAGAAVLNYLMKVSFGRPRPENADPLLFASSLSFPSGHAMATIVLSGVGAYLVARLVSSWRRRAVLVALLLSWPVLIGFSRLYLGVHYVSDVVAGYAAGVAWVAVCVSGVEIAIRRE